MFESEPSNGDQTMKVVFYAVLFFGLMVVSFITGIYIERNYSGAPARPALPQSAVTAKQDCDTVILLESGDGNDWSYTPVLAPPGAWAAPCGNSKWIFTKSNGLDPYVGYVFSDTRVFQIPADTDLANSTFKLQFQADDQVNVLINGVTADTCVVTKSSNCFSDCHAINLPSTSFGIGTNVIEFNCMDTYDSPSNIGNYGGLDFEFKADLKVVCPPSNSK
jgi:hypothetical protein